MSVIPELTITAIRDHGTPPLTAYESALNSACKEYPPPYGMGWYGDKYRSVAIDPSWLANSLISNAAKEGEGSQKLWDLAGRVANPSVSNLIRDHAIDEARHAKLYIRMLEITFPNGIESVLKEPLLRLSPGYTKSHCPPKRTASSRLQVFDEIIQMNIGEIRTRIHQLLLRPIILAHCKPHHRRKLSKILDSLLHDETKHISYTAILINSVMNEDDPAIYADIMKRRLSEFNTITLQEVGELAFDGA